MSVYINKTVIFPRIFLEQIWNPRRHSAQNIFCEIDQNLKLHITSIKFTFSITSQWLKFYFFFSLRILIIFVRLFIVFIENRVKYGTIKAYQILRCTLLHTYQNIFYIFSYLNQKWVHFITTLSIYTFCLVFYVI